MRSAFIQLPPGHYTESDVRMFIGWLSGDIAELHKVEVPKLTESWERFKLQCDLVGEHS
jgi:hypothetical protein